MTKKAIWKYKISEAGEPFTIEMPKGAQVLSVQMQLLSVEAGPEGTAPQAKIAPMMWALVDPTAAIEKRGFVAIATGQEFNPEGWFFIGTFMPDIALVFHLFAWKPPAAEK